MATVNNPQATKYDVRSRSIFRAAEPWTIFSTQSIIHPQRALSMHVRPDRPLIVKCTFDRWNKRITFSSARNCTYDLLRHKVEQCFSLYAASYAIAYKDDDGEITDITTDSDLTEAIQYFQAGIDDPPLSSAASILSGRSFGSRKITLRVHITVDYDGPSLSDTSSLASLEEYKGRNGSQFSFSFGSPSVDLDDDSITVSSRDIGGLSQVDSASPDPLEALPPERRDGKDNSPRLPQAVQRNTCLRSNAAESADSAANGMTGKPKSLPRKEGTRLGRDPFSDEYEHSAADRYPEDPLAVFERLKLEETIQGGSSSIDYDSLAGNDRGAAWLRDQNERTIMSMLGTLPEPSDSDGLSTLESESQMGGDLALRRDPRGKYYYSYTSVGSSSASQAHDSGYDDGTNVYCDIDPSIDGMVRQEKPRPTSMHLNWLASQQIRSPDTRRPKNSLSVPSFHTHNSDPLPSREINHAGGDVPPEILQFLPLAGPPSNGLSDCSECGVLLDSIRYVCSTCGEKAPVGSNASEKGKGKDVFLDSDSDYMTYPPHPHHYTSTSSPANSSSSRTLVGSTESVSSLHPHFHKPLPSLPYLSSSHSGLSVPGSHSSGAGYELCSGCIESAGVNHAIEAGLAPGSSPSVGNSSPSSPEDAQRALQWRRSAPKQKGQLRHAYQEKVWGHSGWEDVEQDECHTSKCSTCTAVTLRKRYKCASCQKFNLCRACYSQVHDLHPSHAFLVVPDKPVRSRSEPDFFPTSSPDPNDEQSLKHPGVKCAHCLLDIVGARFHCAICDSVDICSNCESAGLPGNLDSFNGGHNSSHILIKIPYPLETTEVQTASRRAIHLWMGRDAANVGRATPRSKPSSVVSSYARTVVGSGARHTLDPPADDHHLLCHGCNKSIVGIRYQCGNCTSSPTPYCLCSTCEEGSYIVHDPFHVFFKLPRPVQRPLESSFPLLPKLYRSPAGPAPGSASPGDPKDYLKSLVHSSAVCDRCMTCIQGEWFRCAYCAKDLCDVCEEVDTHNDSHVFLVFKSIVDMQAFKHFADLENPNGSPPVIPYPVYR